MTHGVFAMVTRLPSSARAAPEAASAVKPVTRSVRTAA
jgi:hypothetical protein